MDPAERERLQNRIDLMRSPTLLGASLILPSLAFGVFLLFWGDIATVRQEWENRSIARSSAEITRHKVLRHGPAAAPTSFDHDVEYKYQAGDRELTGALMIPSDQAKSFEIGDVTIRPEVGGKMPVFYAPDMPEVHELYFDPSAAFWSSVTRLSYAGLFLITCVLVAVLVLIFYRPKKTDRSYLPAKIAVDEIKVDG